jgi:hypothetical protein
MAFSSSGLRRVTPVTSKRFTWINGSTTGTSA